MSDSAWIGIDPGPVPGIVELHVLDGVLGEVFVIQCTENIAPSLLRSRLDGLRFTSYGQQVEVQIEQFVVGRRASRSASAGAGRQTRDLIGKLTQEAQDWPVHVRNASQVKTWATDERLDAAGLLEQVKGMRHARDAARHALFVAVHEGALPDPLSKAWQR